MIRALGAVMVYLTALFLALGIATGESGRAVLSDFIHLAFFALIWDFYRCVKELP